MLRSPRIRLALAGGLVLVLALTAGAVLSGRGGDDERTASPADVPPPPRYLALGDSVAVGVGASDPRLSGYVALVRDALAERLGLAASSDAPPVVEATNLAVGGETSASLISDGQLASAIDLLEQSDGAARDVVTLTIGGNDAFALLPVCGRDPVSQPTEACRAASNATLDAVRENLVRILTDLRVAAGPEALIVVGTYYNSLQNPSCLANRLVDLAAPIVERLNGVIADAAAEVPGVRVADVAGAGIGPSDLRADCLHPDDSGYALIADAFLEALGPGLTVR